MTRLYGRTRRALISFLTAGWFLLVFTSDGGEAAPYTFVRIADTSAAFSQVGAPSLNNRGTVVFWAQRPDGTVGYFAGDGSAVTTVVDSPNPFRFDQFAPPSINDSGIIAFAAVSEGIFTRNIAGGPIGTVFTTTTDIPVVNEPSIDNSGTVAFIAVAGGGRAHCVPLPPDDCAGMALDLRIFKRTLVGPLTTIAETGDRFERILMGGLNNRGVAAFNGGSIFAGEAMGVFASDGESTVTIADNGGPFFGFSDLSINDGGQVAFFGHFDLFGGGRGIFVGAGGALGRIVDKNGPFSDFFRLSINSGGTVAFDGTLDAGGGGIFIGPDPVAHKVIAWGDPLDGAVVVFASLAKEGLNDQGQIAFQAVLSDGRSGVYRADPLGRPILAVTASPLDFGSHMVGSVVLRGIDVENVGEGVLTGGATVAPPFFISSGAGFALAAGEKQRITIGFSPTSPGDAQALVDVASNGGDAVGEVRGNGTQASRPGGTVFQWHPGLPDPNRPTIVITHGWQPFEAFSGQSPSWVTDMVTAIQNRHDLANGPEHFNFLIVVWPEAFTGESLKECSVEAALRASPIRAAECLIKAYRQASAVTDDYGERLVRELQSALPANYAKDIHLIGHSFGTAVNAVATKGLAESTLSIRLVQVTLLEAPMVVADVPGPVTISLPVLYTPDWYQQTMPHLGSCYWVDNYHGVGPVPGVEIPPVTTGRDLGGAYNREVNEFHWTIQQGFYNRTVSRTQADQLPPHNAAVGFDFARDGGAYDRRPSPQCWTPPSVTLLDVVTEIPGVVADGIQAGWDVTKGIATGAVDIVSGAATEVMGLFEGSNAAIATQVTIPETASYMRIP